MEPFPGSATRKRRLAVSDSDFIPFALPDIGDAEIEAVVETLRSGWLTTGPRTQEFEERFAAAVEAKHAIAVNSATAAMHLAIEALEIGPGDLVVVPDFTFTATAEVVRYTGADIAFVDIDENTLNMSVSGLARVLETEPSVKAVMPVHFAGLACEMSPILDLCKQANVAIVEDAAHAFPATYRGRTIGSIGTATAFSFYATKTLATGEGGMLTTDSDAIAERARVMRLHGINRNVFDRYVSRKPSWYYEVVAPGFKYNLTDLASAIGLQQLKRSREMLLRRESIARRYIDRWKSLPLILPTERDRGDTHAWHLFVIQLSEETMVTRDQMIAELTKHGVGTSVHFIPLHRHPYWKTRYDLKPRDFPVSETVYDRCLSVPVYSSMTDEQVEHVASAVEEILSR